MSNFKTLLKQPLSEDIGVDKSQEAIHQLKHGHFEAQNPETFRRSLMNSKHKEMLTDYSHEELGKMKLFKVRGKDIGFALKQREGQPHHDELVAVHNNEPGVKGIGDHLVKAAVAHGATHLDHFDGMLSDLYSKHGFKEYHRDAYNPHYDEGGHFAKKYGKRDVVYRKLESHISENVEFRNMVENWAK